MEEKIKRYSFDMNAISEIPFDKYVQDFTFIVNGKQYQTCRILADLISPIICKYHFIDNTINTFSITTNTENQINTNPNNYNNYLNKDKDLFSEFLDMIKSRTTIDIDSENETFYKQILISLGNEQEYMKFIPQINTEITVSNVIDRISLIDELTKTFSSEKIFNKKKKELDFISSHFFEMNKEEMKKLNEEELVYVISNELLQLETEDSLFEFVLDIYKNDHSYSNLFEFIEFSNLTVEKINEFIENFDIDDINKNIWMSICYRLSKKVDKGINKSSRYFIKDDNNEIKENKVESNSKNLEYEQGKEFNGIFNYLTTKSGGNIQANGTISITSNENENPSNPLKNMVDFNTTSHYDSQENTQFHTVTFDFKSMQVKISKYSIKSPDQAPNTNYHMKSWFIESSNDGQTWKTIDHRENCSVLNGKLLTATFDAQMNEFCRYIRYRQSDKNWGNDYYLTINSIEFYGSLKE